MKKKAVFTLVKDIILAAILYGFMALFCSGDTSLSSGVHIFMCLATAGLPFGWRWASKIISATSIKGVAIKAVISALLGCVAIFVVLIGDIIRCFTTPSEAA